MKTVDKLIAKRLFKYIFSFKDNAKKSDIDLFLNEDNSIDVKNMTWIYVSHMQEAKLIGVEEREASSKEDDIVYAIDTDGYLVEVCNGFKNIPYEFLRIQCESFISKSTGEVFAFNRELESQFSNYENWCVKNGIELDVQKAYHDENGNLFTHFFEKPEDSN